MPLVNRKFIPRGDAIYIVDKKKGCKLKIKGNARRKNKKEKKISNNNNRWVCKCISVIVKIVTHCGSNG